MKKNKIILLFCLLLMPVLYIAMCNKRPTGVTSFGFKPSISGYHLFKGKLSSLQPAEGVEKFELSSTLFTDYAEKQRVIRIPKGQKMIIESNGLPKFPSGTIIAKTFYYSNTTKGKRLMETRLLIYLNSVWNAATYKWNDSQDNAFLITSSAKVPVNITAKNGKSYKISYYVPSATECISCHGSQGRIIPIGPKAMNLNISVFRNGDTVNQLQFFKDKNFLSFSNKHALTSIPSWEDPSETIERRARAYMDINCAHCHNESGLAGGTSLRLSYQIKLDKSGIKENKQNIIERTGFMSAFHMPKAGTTIIHEEGVKLMKEYIENLPKQK
jgi:uncharacterized repeat protein (TIGR03806 family)